MIRLDTACRPSAQSIESSHAGAHEVLFHSPAKSRLPLFQLTGATLNTSRPSVEREPKYVKLWQADPLGANRSDRELRHRFAEQAGHIAHAQAVLGVSSQHAWVEHQGRAYPPCWQRLTFGASIATHRLSLEVEVGSAAYRCGPVSALLPTMRNFLAAQSLGARHPAKRPRLLNYTATPPASPRQARSDHPTRTIYKHIYAQLHD